MRQDLVDQPDGPDPLAPELGDKVVERRRNTREPRGDDPVSEPFEPRIVHSLAPRVARPLAAAAARAQHRKHLPGKETDIRAPHPLGHAMRRRFGHASVRGMESVLRFLVTGEGYGAATASILVKTGFLYTIMVTGAIWEKVVFGQYLFAPAFFWEDVFSFAAIALHTAYLWALWTGAVGHAGEMAIALAAYAAYVINAGQFLWKLRMARLDAAAEAGEARA